MSAGLLAMSDSDRIGLWVVAFAWALWIVFILWKVPPWTWRETIERDSPAGYYRVTKARNAIFFILAGGLALLFVWTLCDDWFFK